MGIRSQKVANGKAIPIAFCLAGFSPAVVTETLYGLAVQHKPRIVPARACIMTTQEAYASVVGSLLGSQGAIQGLAAEYRLPAGCFQCTPDDVIIMRSSSGRPLSDIRSSAESRDAGEAIAAYLGQLHSDPGVELHCSIAGGRKTMGALLALALQLCARPGDRLYHVLVNEPFDRIPEFFYPPRKRQYYMLDGKRVDSARARIDLAEIPLVRLGVVAEALGLNAGDLARKAAKIETLMHRRYQAPHLKIDEKRCSLRMDSIEIRLPPQEFALYALYAGLRHKCTRCRLNQGSGCAGCHPTDSELGGRHKETLLRLYRKCQPERGEKLVAMLSSANDGAQAQMDLDEWLRQTRSKLNRRIRTGHSADVVPATVLVRDSRSPDLQKENRRGIALAPARIQFQR